MPTIQKILQVLIANWVLLSFLSAVLVALYVRYAFDIDYFEKYRNASTKKKLSNFYEEMGDRLMGISEWQAAEEAYGAALEINRNNTAATYGIAKAQVFNPLHGDKVSTCEVIDARLEHLLSRSPNDYQILFLKGMRFLDMQKQEEAILWFRKSIDMNPKFIGGHIGLGSVEMSRSNLAAAELNFANAVELYPGSAVARNNLGACLMRSAKFPEATAQFIESYRISPTALIACALGEARWFSGNFEEALDVHQRAANYLNANPDLQDRYTRGGWGAGYLPLQKGDLETSKQSVAVFDVEHKKAILHFQLAIDHALLQGFDDANKEFDLALKLQAPLQIRHLIRNRLQAVTNMVRPMSEATKTWLADHFKLLN